VLGHCCNKLVHLPTIALVALKELGRDGLAIANGFEQGTPWFCFVFLAVVGTICGV
jgi:hypothetical protein